MFIQIGASEGGYGRSFADAGWTAYAFDAAPVYKRSEEQAKAEGNPRFHFYNMAIAPSEERSVTFYVGEKNPTINSLKRHNPDHTPVEVPAISLRRFYKENGISKIDFMMTNVELMDLEIMKTHDWSVPIAALKMECTPYNVMNIYDYTMAQIPAYRHVVFDWRKPRSGAGVQGVCRRKCTAQEFVEVPVNGLAFGNILFYA